MVNYGREVLLNPNARYWGGMSTPDVAPRGGIFGPQGYGGGIFDGMSGLGQTDAEEFPWGRFSEHTQSLQFSTNVELAMRDLPRVAEDGVLGPETCGANLFLYQMAGLAEHEPPSTCQAFEYPPEGAPEPTGPPTVRVAEEREAGAPTYRRRAGMGIGAFLLVAGAVAAGGVYFATRKR